MGINKRMILEEMFSETETDEHEFFMDDDEDDANFEEKMEDLAIEQSIEVFGSDVCDNLEDFDSGKCKHIALQ